MRRYYQQHIFGKKALLVDGGIKWLEAPTIEEIRQDIAEDVPTNVAICNAAMVDPENTNAVFRQIHKLTIRTFELLPVLRAARVLYARSRAVEDYDRYYRIVDTLASVRHELQCLFAQVGVPLSDFQRGNYALEDEPIDLEEEGIAGHA